MTIPFVSAFCSFGSGLLIRRPACIAISGMQAGHWIATAQVEIFSYRKLRRQAHAFTSSPGELASVTQGRFFTASNWHITTGHFLFETGITTRARLIRG